MKEGWKWPLGPCLNQVPSGSVGPFPMIITFRLKQCKGARRSLVLIEFIHRKGNAMDHLAPLFRQQPSR